MGSDRKMGHVQSMKTYVGVFLALLVLTIITYAAAGQFENKLVSNLVAVGIAAVKASLVTWFFMHGRFENKETWAFVWYPVVLLGLLLGGLFLDYANRPEWAPAVEAKTVGTKTEYMKSHGHEGDHGAPAADHGEASHGTDASGDHGTKPADDHGTEPADNHDDSGATEDKGHDETNNDSGDH